MACGFQYFFSKIFVLLHWKQSSVILVLLIHHTLEYNILNCIVIVILDVYYWTISYCKVWEKVHIITKILYNSQLSEYLKENINILHIFKFAKLRDTWMTSSTSKSVCPENKVLSNFISQPFFLLNIMPIHFEVIWKYSHFLPPSKFQLLSFILGFWSIWIVVITIFTHIARPLLHSKKYSNTKCETNFHCLYDCGTGRVDHWWLLSCFYYFSSYLAVVNIHDRRPPKIVFSS